MRTINNLLTAVEKIDIGQTCSASVDTTKNDYLQKNRDQLFDGKTKSGADLSPSYLDDPYFKSPEAAQRYSDWKDRITPNDKRKKGVPNLFINGTFYRSLLVQVQGEEIKTESTFSESSDIVSKFSGDIYGLGGSYKSEYIVENLAPVVSKQLVTQLNEK